MTLAAAFGDAMRAHGPVRQAPVAPVPSDYEPWLRLLLPHLATLAPHHHRFWRWVWAIERESTPDPFLGIWSRGGGKTTSAEGSAVGLGARGKRRYCLYVRGTQDRADDSVSNIAALLESRPITRYYPEHADRKVGKHGNARAWRRNRVWTRGGFVVDAIGLDTAARGVKLEDQRPDLIIFDDLDDKLDSPATTVKKIETLTSSILPAGAWNAAVLGIQNLILPDGIFSQLADGRADFLTRRTLSGPVPALEGLETQEVEEPETHTRRHVIVAGTPTWAGQDVKACQKLMDLIGHGTFLKECQHEVKGKREGLVLRATEAHREVLTPEQVRRLARLGQVFGAIDFGAWRFGFILRAADEHGVVHELAEYFSQREVLEVRAKAIIALCEAMAPGVKRIRLWGDAANPQDIMELNRAFAKQGSRLRVVAVKGEHKARAASVERMNDALDRNALKYRLDVTAVCAPILAAALERPEGEFHSWRLRWNAAGEGVPMQGSRLWWELGQWSYPNPKEAEAQKQDPNDHTADGGDLIAADRYALMSFWRPGKEPPDEEDFSVNDPEALKAEVERTRKLGNRRKAAKAGGYIPTDDGGY